MARWRSRRTHAPSPGRTDRAGDHAAGASAYPLHLSPRCLGRSARAATPPGSGAWSYASRPAATKRRTGPGSARRSRWLPELPTARASLAVRGAAARRAGRTLLRRAGGSVPAGSGVRGPRVAARVLEPDGRRSASRGKEPRWCRRRARGVYATPPALTRFVVRSVDALLRSRFGNAGARRTRPPPPRSRRRADELRPGGVSARPGATPAEPRQERLRSLLARSPHPSLSRHRDSAGAVGGRPKSGAALRGAFRGRAASHPGASLPGGCSRLTWGESAGRLSRPGGSCSRASCERSALAVLLGNPPFRGHSANTGGWIADLLRGYALPDGRTDEGYFQVEVTRWGSAISSGCRTTM